MRDEEGPAAILGLEDPERLARAGRAGGVVCRAQRLDQRAEPQSDGARARDLVDTDDGVSLARRREDGLDLIERERVRPAGERVQLHDLDIRLLGCPARRVVVAVDVLPLGRHVPVVQRRHTVRGDGILGDDVDAQVGEDLWHVVIDEGVEMVGTTHQQDDLPTVPPGVLEEPNAGRPNGLAILDLGGEREPEGAIELPAPHAQASQVRRAPLAQQLVVLEGDGRHVEGDAVSAGRIDGAADHVRVAGDDGAVVGVGGVVIRAVLGEDHREEDAVHTLLHEVVDVAMDELGREADVVRHHRPDAGGVELGRGWFGELDRETALDKQGVPERE